MNQPPAPFLKWAGGKGKLVPLVLDRAPQAFRRYHEPFVGGGAVFFAFAATRALTGPRLNDANPGLIACYTAIRDDCEAVIAALRPLAAEYGARDAAARPTFYYGVRAEVPTAAAGRAARLIFLNRTCYNGLFRVNSRGLFNVPHGRYTNPGILDEARLLAAAHALAGAHLTCGDFAAACDAAEPGDFVYLDPPYQPLSATANFTSYTAGDFLPADQERLRNAFEALTRRGVAALLSNSDHPAVRALYDGFGYSFETVPMSRAINSRGAGRAPVPELLIGNLARPEVRAALAALAVC